MNFEELKAELVAYEVRLGVVGDKLKYSAPKPIPLATLELMKQHKAELMAQMRDDTIAELLLRYQLGEFEPDVRQRLARIFKENPPDAIERLLKAAEYLSIDGSRAEEYGAKLSSAET